MTGQRTRDPVECGRGCGRLVAVADRPHALADHEATCRAGDPPVADCALCGALVPLSRWAEHWPVCPKVELERARADRTVVAGRYEDA